MSRALVNVAAVSDWLCQWSKRRQCQQRAAGRLFLRTLQLSTVCLPQTFVACLELFLVLLTCAVIMCVDITPGQARVAGEGSMFSGCSSFFLSICPIGDAMEKLLGGGGKSWFYGYGWWGPGGFAEIIGVHGQWPLAPPLPLCRVSMIRPTLVPNIHYQTGKILKVKETILLQISISSLRGKDMKRSGGQRSRSCSAKIGHRNPFRPELKNCSTNFSHTWRAHIMVTAHCVTTSWMQKVKGQGHTRPKIDLEDLAEASFLTTLGRVLF